eukprot:3093639-Prymnesium_polylepis.2
MTNLLIDQLPQYLACGVRHAHTAHGAPVPASKRNGEHQVERAGVPLHDADKDMVEVRPAELLVVCLAKILCERMWLADRPLFGGHVTEGLQ